MDTKLLPPTAPGEAWKIIPLAELQKRYYISSFGRIFDALKKRFIKTHDTNVNGYKRKDGETPSEHWYKSVMLTTNLPNNWPSKPYLKYLRKTYFIHRLVAMTFIGKPRGDKIQIDHLDRDTLNNKVYISKSGKITASNLRWVSKRDNTRRLTEKQVWKILGLLHKHGPNYNEIAKIVGLDYHLVRNMNTHKIWLDLKQKYNEKVGEEVFSI